MNFLVDENLPPALASWLQSKGHNAIHVQELRLLGQPDQTIMAAAQQHRRIVITKDSDFDQAIDVQVIRVDIGNAPTQALLAWLEPRLSHAVAQCAAGATLVVVA